MIVKIIRTRCLKYNQIVDLSMNTNILLNLNAHDRTDRLIENPLSLLSSQWVAFYTVD